MIEGRATGTCSLGPLIRADVAASDSLPGTGLIKWRGSCELLGVFSPQMGAAVTFSYTIQGKATQTIPKKFRVLSSFADPLANNGRGQTTVELGCLLTYMEDAAEPTELKSRDDDELGNESQSDEDFDAIGASVSARFAFKQCANAIGVSFNFRDGALESTFRVDTIDLKVGYISVMSDLLVSESMVGELDANEVLQIRRLTEASGEAGKLLNTSNILSIAPLNAGELPGENVAVEYSSWRLKEPDENDGLFDPWEKVITVGPEGRLFLGFTYLNTRGLEFGVGIINTVTPIKNYFDYTPVQETTTYYREVTVDGQTRSVTDRTETVLTTSLAAVMPSVFISWFLTVGTVIGISDLEATSITTTEYEYNERGEVTREVTEIYEDAPVLVGKLGISVGRFISSIQLENLERTLIALLGKDQFLTGRTIVEYEYSSDKRLIVTKESIHYAYTQEGQQAAVETGTFVRLESDVYDLWNTIGNRGYELVPKSTVTQTTLRPSRPENVVPSKSERLSVGSADDPLERSTETVWVYGDQQSIRRRVFRMPFAPDDLVTGTSGNYSVTESNAEDVARLFGRVQNKLLFGARYGVQLQLLPVQVPAMAFDALNVDLAGVMGQFRLNNLSYVIEPGEVVCGCNALYWGTIGSTPYSGTASGSWVPLPASSSGYTAPQDMNTVEAGTTVVISSVGTTSQEDWNTLAGTSGVTYSEGDTITAVVDGSTLDSSTGTVSTLQPAPTPTSDATLGDVVVTSPEDVQEPFSTTERYRLSATRGRFLLTGLEAEGRLGVRYQLESEDPLFFLVGRPVELRKSIRYELTADVAVFSIAAEDIELVAPDKITADAGSFIYTGISTQLEYLPDTLQIGDSFQGGFFAGYISHTADGNPTHALIVAPRATGATGTGYTLTTNLKWADQNVANPANATLIGANNEFDGKVNTDLMMSLIANGTYSAGAFPAAQFCADLAIGGFTDWYLPARWELDIAYENLKPTTEDNSIDSGINDYSVPKRTINRTTTSTQQTSVTAFQSTGAEPFVDNTHWSSEQGTFAGGARILFFGNGNQFTFGNTNTFRVRAFRKVPL
jgi:hypothetical protein